MNQPSDEALERLYAFLLKTSVPRILEKERLIEARMKKDDGSKLGSQNAKLRSDE
jgi:hypothetical protein